MDLANHPFSNEIYNILTTNNYETNVYLTGTILAGKSLVDILAFVSMDRVSDYVMSYGEKIQITVLIGLGTYNKYILPFKEELYFNLILKILGPSTGSDLNGEDVLQKQTFKAIVVDLRSKAIALDNESVRDEESANISGMVHLRLQLLDRSIEYLKLLEVGGGFRYANPAEVTKGLLSRESQSNSVDEEYRIQGITMVEANNVQRYDPINIPHGTPLLDVPEYCQVLAGGIYSAGLGFFLAKNRMFLWPLYDLSLIERSTKSISIFLLSKASIMGAENTFRVTNNQLIILATGNAEGFDRTEQKIDNYGSGVRMPEPERLIDGFVRVKDQKATAIRNFNNSEFETIDRKNQLSITPVINNPLTNQYHEASKLSSRMGFDLIVTWENSAPHRIVPGTPVKLFYTDENGSNNLNAVILSHHSYYSQGNQGIVTSKYLVTTAIRLFVAKDMESYTLYKEENNVNYY